MSDDSVTTATPAPIWETLPVKLSPDGIRRCCLPDCTQPMYAKRLCQKHYAAVRKGQLNPATGELLASAKVLSIPQPVTVIDELGNKKKETMPFGSLEQWVYTIPDCMLINRLTNKRVSLFAASHTWGAWIKDAVREGKIDRYWGETFLPGNPPPDGKDLYNSYIQLDSMTPKGDGPATLDRYLEILLNNLGGKSVEYLKDWLAYGFQNYDSGSVALVLHGVPGAGKGVLTSVLKSIYGPYLHTVNASTLQNEFNAWIERKLLIVANEIASGTFRERQHTMDRLKEWVMPDLIEINKKGVNQYQYQNCSRWIFCSNDRHPVDIAPDDRRYSVIYSDKRIDPDLGKYISNNAPQFGRNLLEHLAHRDISKFEPMRPLENDDRNEVRDHLQQIGKVFAIR